MCGPLMLALPVRHLDKGKQVLIFFLYNTGRITTYSLIGHYWDWPAVEFTWPVFSDGLLL